MDREDTAQNKAAFKDFTSCPAASIAAPFFSHIYVEKDAFEYADTQNILQRLSHAKVISINSYKEVFNRPQQDWNAQRASKNLILAKRRHEFLYRGSLACDSFGHKNFFYNTLCMNCLYDCDYCYLQGLYPSANVVLFVNCQDYIEHTRQALRDLSSLYLCLSYDSDLLALEGLVPFCQRWIEFAQNTPNLSLEIRTKSANYSAISQIKPSQNVTLAWTLSPQSIVEKYEHKSATLEARLRAASKAAQDGWAVRLCFDPLLLVPDWKKEYADLFAQTFTAIPAHLIKDVSLGVFRISSQFLRRIQAQRNGPDILFHPFEKEELAAGESYATYSRAQKEEMLSFANSELAKHYQACEPK